MQSIANLFSLNPLRDVIIDNCEDIVTVKDIDMKYVFCNKAFLRLLGLKDKVKLYAFVDKAGVQLIQKGDIIAGAIQEPDKLARLATDSVKKYLSGDTNNIEYILNSPPLLVNKDNAAEVLPFAY